MDISILSLLNNAGAAVIGGVIAGLASLEAIDRQLLLNRKLQRELDEHDKKTFLDLFKFFVNEEAQSVGLKSLHERSMVTDFLDVIIPFEYDDTKIKLIDDNLKHIASLERTLMESILTAYTNRSQFVRAAIMHNYYLKKAVELDIDAQKNRTSEHVKAAEERKLVCQNYLPVFRQVLDEYYTSLLSLNKKLQHCSGI